MTGQRRRAGPGARVLGTESLSSTGLWTPFSATAWSTSFDPDTNTRQVFVDGEPLVIERWGDLDAAIQRSLAG